MRANYNNEAKKWHKGLSLVPAPVGDSRGCNYNFYGDIEMDRLEMIRRARRLAYEEVDGVVACNDAQYDELKNLPEEEAVQILAHEFLQEAADNNFGN